jgi:hypothetical protein
LSSKENKDAAAVAAGDDKDTVFNILLKIIVTR